MKKRMQLHNTALMQGDRFLFSRTGEHCPSSGWWTPLNDETDAHFLSEGSVMPSVGGSPATWKLVPHLQRVQRPTHEYPPKGFALDSI